MAVNPISLAQALRLAAAPRVAFVGAGGKTSAMFRLARELPGPVLATTTTHLGLDQLQLADRIIHLQSAADLPTSLGELSAGVNLFMGAPAGGERTAGPDAASLDQLLVFADAHHLPLLIEADGSRMLPVKAPAAHEPVIPPSVDTVVVVAGLSALGRPLSDDYVHRVELFSGLSGLPRMCLITADALQRVLLHPDGGLKNIPPQAKRVALLNQADTPELLQAAISMTGSPYAGAPGLLAEYDAVIPAVRGEPLAVYERVGGILLAAGAARRWRQGGQELPKQLALVDGEPLVRRAARRALEAGLDPLIVITGYLAEQVQPALDGLAVQVVYCPQWDEGMSASLKAGLAQLPAGPGSAIFLLADQPFLPADVLSELAHAHARSLAKITAPRIAGRRANPVLFDRVLFPGLLQLSGDAGGRSLFDQVAPADISWVDRSDEHAFVDVDTWEAYRQAVDHESR